MHTDMPRKLMALQTFYRIHEKTLEPVELACKKGCSVCCTRNVTLTSLEAYYLMSHLGPDGRDAALSRIQNQAHLRHMIPSITLNRMAEMCMNGQEPPEDESDPSWGPCPLLQDGLCTVYEVRPLACRVMVSRAHCSDSGFADMDEFLVAVNNVLMQYLEHIDAGSIMGNMNDLLPVFADEKHRDSYWKTGHLNLSSGRFIKNQPLTMLMVPPEHRERIQTVLRDIEKV